MSTLFKVRHRLLDDFRVIKVLNPGLAREPDFCERFLREAKALSSLRHPNIVGIYDFSADSEGSAFIVLEFVEGVTLRQMISLQPQINLAVEIFYQTAQALTYVHTEGFIHRDISPDNIMFTTKGTLPLVKLLDFGVTKGPRWPELTATGMFFGKLRYSSPEAFSNFNSVSAHSDLYSLGLVMYEVLTGVSPLGENSDPASMMSAQMYKSPIPFSTTDPTQRIPKSVQDIVMRLLEKDPKHRLSAEGLIDSLSAVQKKFPYKHHKTNFTDRIKLDSSLPNENPEQSKTILAARVLREPYLEEERYIEPALLIAEPIEFQRKSKQSGTREVRKNAKESHSQHGDYSDWDLVLEVAEKLSDSASLLVERTESVVRHWEEI